MLKDGDVNLLLRVKHVSPKIACSRYITRPIHVFHQCHSSNKLQSNLPAKTFLLFFLNSTSVTMKFSIAAVAGLLSAVSAASLPAAFTLVAEGGLTVLTDGGTLLLPCQHI